jgi:hypothetical protein
MATERAQKAELTFKSSTTKARPGSAILMWMLGALMVIGCALIIVATAGLLNPPWYGTVPFGSLAAGIVFVAYAGWYYRRLFLDSKREVRMDLFDNEVVLYVREPNGRRVSTRMAFADIDFLEYYSVRDRESLVFHSKDGRIVEVPMWAMEQGSQPAIGYLSDRGIRVVTL